MSISIKKIVNPWRKGFQPPSKCPFCRRVNTLIFTGQRMKKTNDHVYHCTYCDKRVGAPTHYAWCKLFDIQLEKDVFYTPCIKCPQRKPSSIQGVCIHWRDRHTSDLPNIDEIEKTLKRYKPDEH